jgi:hypothetical protein
VPDPPPVERLLADLQPLAHLRIVDPCACSFSASRSFATICSVVNLLFAAITHRHEDSQSYDPQTEDGPKLGGQDSRKRRR